VRGVRFLGDRRLTVETVDDPTPGTGEVVIAMRAAGLCGSDLRVFRSSAVGGEIAEAIVGHEPCGVVVAVGEGVRSDWQGARVVVSHHYGCGRCEQCRVGATKHCAGGGTYGVTDNGADADYMAARESALVRLPDEVDFESGAMIACCAGTAYVALVRAQVAEGETVVVIGQGPVGLSVTALARGLGARVIAADPVEERRALAVTLGADHVIDVSASDLGEVLDDLTAGAGAPAVIECSGAETARVDALRVAGIRGRICFIGNGPPVRIDVGEYLIGKDLSCFGSWTFTNPELEACAAFVARERLRLSDLATHRFAIDDAELAFDAFERGGTGKCLFVFGDS
jgi:(R,R)-butanediol dehydrogenase / meso-butanediol dehydrogenase / diacetyl reductase